MKKVFVFVLFIATFFTARAERQWWDLYQTNEGQWVGAPQLFFAGAKYYISNTGNNLNAGTSPGAAWADVTKLNSSWGSIVAGDSIFFNRGDTFSGTRINIGKSGSNAARIFIGAYGTGAKPVISGFTKPTIWLSVGPNKWQTSLSNTNRPNMVLIDGVVGQKARWPNAGYKRITGHTANTITDNTLTGVPPPANLTGAMLLFRPLHDQQSLARILSMAGNTITFQTINQYAPQDGYGWFAQDMLALVDTTNEYYQDPSTQVFTVYHIGTPGAGVQVATMDTLLYNAGFDYITIDNLSFEGGNHAAIASGGPPSFQALNVTVQNCAFKNSGHDAIYSSFDSNTKIDNNSFLNTQNCAINLENEGSRSLNAIVTNNTILNTGTVPGGWGTVNANGNAITMLGDGSLVQYNYIDNVGHCGVYFWYDNVHVLNNLINNFCTVGGDAGAINTFDPSILTPTPVTEVGRQIKYNIITNGSYAEAAGTFDNFPVVMGIYIDDGADGVDVSNNYVNGSPQANFFLHNGRFITVRNNIFYNANQVQVLLRHDDHTPTLPIRGVIFENNQLFAAQGNQDVIQILTRRNDVDSIFTSINNNFYARPSLVTGSFFKTTVFYRIAGSQQDRNYTLPTWQTNFGLYDQTSFVATSSPNRSSFLYNYSRTPVDSLFAGFSRTEPYTGAVYNNGITIAGDFAYVLLDNGLAPSINKIPVAQAGNDTTITLPADSAILAGSGSDTDGVIVGTLWQQLSGGPLTASIDTPFRATTRVRGMTTAGIYEFRLQVTDNNGEVGYDIKRVIVLAPAPVLVPPVAHAASRTIRLPQDTVIMVGSGTDGDGSITGYLWEKDDADVTATIVSPTSATTAITGLPVGTHRYKLTVTDNDGLTGTVLVQVIVLPVYTVPRGVTVRGYKIRSN